MRQTNPEEEAGVTNQLIFPLGVFEHPSKAKFSPRNLSSFGFQFELRQFLLHNAFPLIFSLHAGMLILSNCLFYKNTQGIF